MRNKFCILYSVTIEQYTVQLNSTPPYHKYTTLPHITPP